MHLKVFLKLKKTLKTLSSGQKKPKKNPLGWFFKKPGFFQPCFLPIIFHFPCLLITFLLLILLFPFLYFFILHILFLLLIFQFLFSSFPSLLSPHSLLLVYTLFPFLLHMHSSLTYKYFLFPTTHSHNLLVLTVASCPSFLRIS
jgi:hypothetical protein